MSAVRVIAILFRAYLLWRAVLAAEILALCHQLGVFQRSVMASCEIGWRVSGVLGA